MLRSWLRHFKSNTAGISAAYSSELTKKAIFNALWDRQVYGTTGARIIVDFSVNGYPMGSEITVSSQAAERKIRLEVEGTDDIKYVAVIKNNEQWYSKEGSGKSVSLELSDEGQVVGTDFYYVRVVQQDGHMAWSSPVRVSVR